MNNQMMKDSSQSESIEPRSIEVSTTTNTGSNAFAGKKPQRLSLESDAGQGKTEIAPEIWKEETVDDSKIIQAFDEAWIDDGFIADSLFDIASNAERFNKEWDTIPDYATRLAAIKQISQIKGHFDQKARKAKKNTDLVYVLVRDA